MMAYATYGNGRVVALGDSSPADDGTGGQIMMLCNNRVVWPETNRAKLIAQWQLVLGFGTKGFFAKQSNRVAPFPEFILKSRNFGRKPGRDKIFRKSYLYRGEPLQFLPPLRKLGGFFKRGRPKRSGGATYWVSIGRAPFGGSGVFPFAAKGFWRPPYAQGKNIFFLRKGRLRSLQKKTPTGVCVSTRRHHPIVGSTTLEEISPPPPIKELCAAGAHLNFSVWVARQF